MTGSGSGRTAHAHAQRSFDLSSAILAGRKTTRILQATFASTTAVRAGGLLYVVATALENGATTIGFSSFTLAAVGLVAVFLAVSILALVGVGPGAAGCVLEEGGLQLRYSSGRERNISWHDPKFRLRLTAVKTAANVSYDLTVGWPMINPILRFPMLNPVSFELYSAVLQEAQSRGLDVRSDTTAGGDVSVTTHEIRAKLASST